MYAIAIDGPSASGKGAISDKLSEILGILHLNSGALYRAVAHFAITNKLSFDNLDNIYQELQTHTIDIDFKDGKQLTLLDGKDVTPYLYTSEASLGSAKVSKHSGIRSFVLEAQLKTAKNHSLVLEGRDIGSVVLPNAKYKFYLDANLEVRAERRLKDFIARGEKLTYDDVKNMLKERDEADFTRTVSPLVRVPEAIYIDSSYMTIDEVVDKILSYIEEYK